MSDWPPPLPTYTSDIGGNVVNSIGWAFEALNPLTLIGSNAVYGMGTQNSPKQKGSPVQTKVYSHLDQILLSSPFTAPLVGPTSAAPAVTRNNPSAGAIPLTVVALPVIAAVLVAGFLVWRSR